MLFLFFGQNYEHQLRRSFGQTTHRVIHIVASHHGDQTRAVNIPLILALCHSVSTHSAKNHQPQLRSAGWLIDIQGVLGLHEFWAREKLVQAKFVLVKLCTSSFVKLRASEIRSTCYPRNGLYTSRARK